MIHPGGWYFLTNFPELYQADWVSRELRMLDRRGDRQLAVGTRCLGVMTIALGGFIAGAVLDHPTVGAMSLVLTAVGWSAHSYYGRQFDRTFRRVEYLRGYMQAKAGQGCQPP